jgi:hypothetical protein
VLIEQSFPAPIGGVSQRPPHLRSPAEVTEAINTFPSLLEGLGVRHGTQLVTTFPVSSNPSSSHTIDWSPDARSRFWVTIGASGVAITDINTGETFTPVRGQQWGEESESDSDTFAAYEGAFYGSVTEPNSFTSAVIGDTVYIGVRGYSRVRWATTQAPVVPATATVQIVATGPELFHTFTVGNSQFTNVGAFWANTTPAFVAGNFSDMMNEDAAFSAEYEATVNIDDLATSPGIIVIRRKDVNDQSTIPISSANLPENLTITVNSVSSQDKLPETAPEGFIVRIAGLSTTTVDDYWVIRENGRWKECVAPGSNTTIDPYLMPWALKLTGRTVGIPAFKFGPIPWETRRAGDDTSNPLPALDEINTIFSVEQRLGLTSGTTIVLSESNIPQNLFRTTITQVLPSDPVGIKSSVGPNAPYHTFVSWDNSTYLWSDQAQVELRGEPVITPTTVSLSLESRCENDARVTPTVIGSRIYFTRSVNGYTRVFEYWRPPGFNMPPRADEVTESVPTYLVGNPTRLAVDDALGVLMVMTDASDSTIYICHFTRDGNGQIQPRWHTWQFAGASIYAMRMMAGRLYLLTTREDDTTLIVESLDVANPAPFQTDLPYDLDRVVVDPTVILDGFFIRDREGAVTQQRWIIRNLTLDYLRTFQGRVDNLDDSTPLIRMTRTPLPMTGKIRTPLHRRHDRLTLRLKWQGFLTTVHLQGSLSDRSQRARA